MHAEPFQVLRAQGPGAAAPAARKPRLVIAGATGALGNEVLRTLVGLQRFQTTEVLATEPITAGLRGVSTWVAAGADPAQWPPTRADTAVVMFEPPRLFYDRERALWTPVPAQLVALARWLRASGVGSLAIVLPHAQMRLPEALKRGLASLDEQAVASLGFERVLIVRSAQKPETETGGHALVALARWMLSVFRYMIPSSEQPVRAAKIAQFVSLALQLAPAGIHVAASETVREAAQQPDMRDFVARWLAGGFRQNGPRHAQEKQAPGSQPRR